MDLIHIGASGKTVGSSGAVKVFLDPPYDQYIDLFNFLFFNIDGSIVPFQVLQTEVKGDLRITFQDVNSPGEAAPLTGQPVFIEKQKWKELQKNTEVDTPLDLTSLFGWTLCDQEGEKVGIIKRVEEYPQQMMAIVERADTGDLTVPLVEEWVLELDTDEQRIVMDLPEGLLNIGHAG